VFCIAEEDSEADELKTDVKKFLYDLRMQADVIVVTMKSWEDHQEDDQVVESTGRDGAMESFSKARKRIAQHTAGNLEAAESSSSNFSQPALTAVDEQQVNTIFPSCSGSDASFSSAVCYMRIYESLLRSDYNFPLLRTSELREPIPVDVFEWLFS